MQFEPAMTTLELHITYRCNLRCNNCCALVGVAPYEKDMTLDEIVTFVRESSELDYPWTGIVLWGGEPTMHKDIFEIASILRAYQLMRNPGVLLQIVSNGNHKDITTKLQDEYNIQSMISEKHADNATATGTTIPYDCVMDSPADHGYPSPAGCRSIQYCGIALNYLGYFACSPAAAAARVFGFKPVARTLAELTTQKILASLPDVCKHCGMPHYENPSRRSNEEQISSTWKAALDKYNGK